MKSQLRFTKNCFASVLDEYNYNIHTGDIVAGTIFNREQKGFLVDIGEKIAGYLPSDEISLVNENIENMINKLNNETREFFILAYNKKSKQLILSIKRLEYIRGWKRIKQIENEDIVLNLITKKFNKGGIIILLEKIQGFIPNSHLLKKTNKLSLKYKSIKCKLLSANEKTNQLILSQKKAMLDLLKHKFTSGCIVSGKIIDIKPYGIFIQIYTIVALLHISEIGYTNIQNLQNLFSIGQKLQVKILHIDMEQGRLSVSTKNLYM